MSSIAAVSQVTMKTRRHIDDHGFMIRIHGGVLKISQPCGVPCGTSMEVRNLFYNVPARRSFLKTPATEFKHLVDTFQTLALANPGVAFSLYHDNNEVYRLLRPSSDDFETALGERISAIFGVDYAEKIVPVRESTSYLSARGFLGRAEFNRRSRGEQFLFVNGRFVRSRSLRHAILSAYEGLLPERAHPFYTFFLDLDARHIDVNVHPTKAEIKFDDERGVYGFVQAVARKTLGAVDLVPRFEDAPRQDSSEAPTQREVTPEGGGGSEIQPLTMPLHPDMPLFGKMSADERVVPSETTEVNSRKVERPEGEPLLWQLHSRYVLTQLRSGLLILDQRAAHERILYERALESMDNGLGMSQQLLFPQTLEFGPSDFALLKEIKQDLISLGFSLEVYSGRTVILRGVPADVRPGGERNILNDLIHQYKTNQRSLRIAGRDNVARSIARHGAIKAGETLSVKEMRSLIDRLFMCEKPYTSPYGRLTMIKVSIEELARRFGR